jgi:outer membrane protein
MKFSHYLLALPALLLAARLPAAELEVTLSNPPQQGRVVMVLFDSANAFGDFRDPFLVERARAGKSSHVITQLPAGEYALLVFNDANDNRQLDRNFIGIPLEPIGFSNGYRPKGPPQFRKARFVLGAEEHGHMTVTLEPILGKHGTWGLGAGVIYQSSPYRGSNQDVVQPIPTFIYVGNRLQLGGPRLRYALLGRHRNRLALSAEYRVGAYKESDSAYLEGMGNRKDTLMAGLSLVSELPGGITVGLGYQYDVLGRIDGGSAELGLHKTYQLGPVSLSPSLKVNWLSAALANHDFGVRPEQARPDRPAYDLDGTFSPEAGCSVYAELGANWSLMMNAGVEFLDSDIRHSPIVNQDKLFKGFVAVFYLF